jgi:hypothetical protein
VVEVTCRPGPIAGLERPTKAVGGRAVVQARRVSAAPAAAVVRTGVRVAERSSRAASSRSTVWHDVLADG